MCVEHNTHMTHDILAMAGELFAMSRDISDVTSDICTVTFVAGCHIQKQAPQTKERTKVESQASIMLGPQLSMLSMLNISCKFRGRGRERGVCKEE